MKKSIIDTEISFKDVATEDVTIKFLAGHIYMECKRGPVLSSLLLDRDMARKLAKLFNKFADSKREVSK